MIINVPKQFHKNTIIEFLGKSESVFELKGKRAPDTVLNCENITKMDMLGVLLIYKFLEFAVTNKCYKNPQIIVGEESSAFRQAIKDYGFEELIFKFINNKVPLSKDYSELEILSDDKFIIAPHALLREGDYSSQSLQNIFLPGIEKYYSENPKTVRMIFTFLGEIVLNFWEHAVDDSKSIIVAKGNHDLLEIACADTGSGIFTSLSNFVNEKHRQKDKILLKAIEQGTTSKKGTAHMGYGLWILNELIKLVNGSFHIYSQGGYYINEYRKIRNNKCGYWQGTIIYLSIPLKNPKNLTDIPMHEKNQQFKKLQLNFS